MPPSGAFSGLTIAATGQGQGNVLALDLRSLALLVRLLVRLLALSLTLTPAMLPHLPSPPTIAVVLRSD